MVRMRGWLWVIVILGLLAPVAPPVRAAEEFCGPPLDWQKLATLTRRHFRQPERMDAETPREIAEALRAINWARLHAWQTHIAQPEIRRLMDSSTDNLRNFASTGRTSLPRGLLTDLKTIDRLSKDICVQVDGDGLGAVGVFDDEPASPAGFGMSPEGETLADYVRLSILPVIVAAFAVILKVCHIIYKLTQTRRYSRRSCRVTAELHIGRYVIPGTITVLGLHGCRMIPETEEARALLSVVAESAETQVLVGSIRIPAHVVALHDNWSAILFQAALDHGLHATILERSEIRPRPVTLPGLRHNVPRRKDGDATPAGTPEQPQNLPNNQPRDQNGKEDAA